MASRINDDKTENQEILAVIRDPFYKYSSPCIPDGSVEYSGGIQCHCSFEIEIPFDLTTNIDVIVNPSWQCPVSYRRQGTPWVTHVADYENIVLNKPRGNNAVWNTFELVCPPLSAAGDQLPFPMDYLADGFQAPLGPLNPRDYIVDINTLGSGTTKQRFKKWRHVSSGIRMFTSQDNGVDPLPNLFVRNLRIPTDPNNYSWLAPQSTTVRNPANLEQFVTSQITRVVLVNDFDPFQAVSNADGTFKNMRNVWSGSIRDVCQTKFILKASEAMFNGGPRWNDIPSSLTCLTYKDSSLWGCPLQTTPWNNDLDIIDSCIDRRFDGLHMRIVPAPGRTQNIILIVEFVGNYEVIVNAPHIPRETAQFGGPVMDRTHYLSKYKQIYKEQSRKSTPGEVL